MQRRKAAALLIAILLPAGQIVATDKLPDHHISQWKLGESLTGAPITPAFLAGKVTLLTQWGTRSQPSIKTLATLAALDKKHRAAGLVTIAAEVQKSDRETILEIIGQEKLTYPIVLGSEGPPIGGRGLPKSFLFDIAGKLVFLGHPQASGLHVALKKSLRSRSRQQIAAGIDAAAPVGERLWTLADGTKITATLIEAKGEHVKLRLAGGRVITKKIAELAPKEQRNLAE